MLVKRNQKFKLRFADILFLCLWSWKSSANLTSIRCIDFIKKDLNRCISSCDIFFVKWNRLETRIFVIQKWVVNLNWCDLVPSFSNRPIYFHYHVVLFASDITGKVTFFKNRPIPFSLIRKGLSGGWKLKKITIILSQWLWVIYCMPYMLFLNLEEMQVNAYDDTPTSQKHTPSLTHTKPGFVLIVSD